VTLKGGLRAEPLGAHAFVRREGAGRLLEIQIRSIATEVARFTRRPKIAAQPTIAVVPHSAAHAERDDSDQDRQHD